MEKNNNNFKNWKCKVDEFRGFMKSEVESLKNLVTTHCKGAETRRTEINTELKGINEKMGKVEQYMAARKAVRSFKSALWGFVGGLVSLGVGFILYKIFK